MGNGTGAEAQLCCINAATEVLLKLFFYATRSVTAAVNLLCKTGRQNLWILRGSVFSVKGVQKGFRKKEKGRKVVQVNATQFGSFYFNLSADACYINI